MSKETIKVPDIGGAEGVEVIEICVDVGDDVAAEDSLIVLESDKASMEVPSPKAGKVAAIKVATGDTVSEGDVIMEFEAADDGDAEADDADEQATKGTAQEASTADSGETQAEPAVEPEQPAAGADKTPSQSSEAPVEVPDLGGPEEVEVIEVCVAAGDEVAEGDSLIVLESDKASMEVPSPRSGKVVSLSMKVGDSASKGDEILVLASEQPAGDSAGEKKAPAPEAEQKTEPKAEPAAAETAKEQTASSQAGVSTDKGEAPQPGHAAESTAQPARQTSNTKRDVYAGPAVRKLAREMGINLNEVEASGPRGRTLKDDLKAYVKNRLTGEAKGTVGSGIPPVPAVDFEKFGDVSIEPMSKIHRLTAEGMHRSWLNVPHVTQFDDADITELEDFRKTLKAEAEQRGVKMTPIPFLLKACAAALTANPKFNASLHSDGESIVYKHYVHIGMAVDTPAGLVVPVIRDVDKKSVWELAAEVADVADKAKQRKLTADAMQGGCFTISSLGGIGGQGFTPIVNTPEVAILGVSKLTVKPVWNGSEFTPRQMLPLSLSYDHRAINGADAGRFFTHLNELLADIRRLVL